MDYEILNTNATCTYYREALRLADEALTYLMSHSTDYSCKVAAKAIKAACTKAINKDDLSILTKSIQNNINKYCIK